MLVLALELLKSIEYVEDWIIIFFCRIQTQKLAPLLALSTRWEFWRLQASCPALGNYGISIRWILWGWYSYLVTLSITIPGRNSVLQLLHSHSAKYVLETIINLGLKSKVVIGIRPLWRCLGTLFLL
jgi:hypothetical protein